MLQLSTLPQNEVFSELDMRQINGVCKFFGGIDNKAPHITIEDKNLITLDLFFGYKFSVSREDGIEIRQYRSLRGPRLDQVQCNGYRISTYIDGDEVGQKWFATIEELLMHAFGLIVNHVATNIGESEARALAFSSEDR